MDIDLLARLSLPRGSTAGIIIRKRKLQKKIDRGELDAMPEVQEVDAEMPRTA